VPYVIPFFEDALTASREDVEAWTINPINRYFYIENVWLDRS
jgi:peptide/nickel transport system substrate-binding protein